MAVGGGGVISLDSAVAVAASGEAAEEDDRAMVKEEEGLWDRRARENSCLIAIFDDFRSPFVFFFSFLLKRHSISKN